MRLPWPTSHLGRSLSTTGATVVEVVALRRERGVQGLCGALWTWCGVTGACAMGRTAAGHVDHVVLGVRDLDATAERLRREFGFHAGDRAVVDGTGWGN